MKPTKPGYEEYEVRPALGDLEWMKGDVPTPHGMIHVEMDRRLIKIRATEGRGTLYYKDRQVDIKPNQEVVVTLS